MCLHVVDSTVLASAYCACPLAKGTLPTFPLDSISTSFLASQELANELVRVSGVSRPSPGNLLKLYEDPSDLLVRPTGKNPTVLVQNRLRQEKRFGVPDQS